MKHTSDIESCGWSSFVLVVKIFLGNHITGNYKELVPNLLRNIKNIGTNISMKMYYFQSHLDRFQYNLEDFTEEHGDIKVMKYRYQGRWKTTVGA